jgi:hypothetical protein
MGALVGGLIHGWVGGWINGWVDGWVGGWIVGGWMFIENIAEMGIEKIDEEIKFNNDVF